MKIQPSVTCVSYVEYSHMFKVYVLTDITLNDDNSIKNIIIIVDNQRTSKY